MSSQSITIRRYRDDDVEALYEAARESVAEISPWMAWLDYDYTRDMAEKWVGSRDDAWRDGISYDYVVQDDTGRLLGTVGLNAIDLLSKRANLGYWIRTSAAGQGAATAAGRQLIDLAFSESCPIPAHLHRLEILVAVGNTKSHRVAQKLGGVREAVLRDRLWPSGEPQDAVIYSVLRTDPR